MTARISMKGLTETFKAEDLVKQAVERYQDKIYVAFSGGHCSLVVLHLAIQIKPNIPVMFNNTGVEFPETVVFVHRLQEEWNLNLIENHPEKSFWQCIEDYGVPVGSKGHTKKSRPKCCYWLKEKPFLKAQKEKGFVACFTGIRGEESWTRRNMVKFCGQRYYMKTHNLWKYHPIAFWSKQQVDEYIKENSLPKNPVYSKWNGLYSRVGCMPCTAYKDWERKLRKSHPQMFDFLKKKICEQEGQTQLKELVFA